MANHEEAWETTDVVICGCGPTGAMLSGYLGRFHVPNIVLEKDPDITTDPRGIALDDDGIRLLQGLGFYDKVFAEIGMCIGAMNFIGGKKKTLATKPFLVLEYANAEGGTSHPGVILHKQPFIEKYLRKTITDGKDGSLRVNNTVTAISEDENWVYVTYTEKSGAERKTRAKFLVGADGKTGFTRKKYLEPKGIKMEKTAHTDYEETWVALNWKMTLPTPETHPDFPLWKLGYTPEGVYDQFFPRSFRFICNPERPAVCGRFGLHKDRFWRFEFVINPGEDGVEMASPKKIKEVVFPYLVHEGSRYGLKEEVRYPEDCINVLRCRPFNFYARSCNKWALGRVILCGDAAHVFPPFGGQGIASGFRDASALAWRLAVACRSSSTSTSSTPDQPSYPSLFTSWYTERKQQLDLSLAATVHNGSHVTERNPFRIFIRDWYTYLLSFVPSSLKQPHTNYASMARYHYKPGMIFIPETQEDTYGGGRCFPQVYCVSLKGRDPKTEDVYFTDDVIFAGDKKGLFQLVVLLNSSSELEEARKAIRGIRKSSHGEVNEDEATYIIHDPTARVIPSITMNGSSTATSHQSFRPSDSDVVVRIATAEEFAAKYCHQDDIGDGAPPYPKGYDAYKLLKEVKGANYIILRADRFVFAACRSAEEVKGAAGRVREMLAGVSE